MLCVPESGRSAGATAAASLPLDASKFGLPLAEAAVVAEVAAAAAGTATADPLMPWIGTAASGLGCGICEGFESCSVVLAGCSRFDSLVVTGPEVQGEVGTLTSGV